jgi:hypothetical protein
MREKFNLHFWSYNKGKLTDPLGEPCQPLPPLHQAQIQWQKMSEDTWHLHHPDHPKPYAVTFDPQRFEENPDLQLMAIGNRIFEAIMSTVVEEQTTTQQSETKSPLGSG